jgi:HK97 gp10 family phage protein
VSVGIASIRVVVEADTSGIAALSSAAKQRAVTLKAVKAGARIVQSSAKANAPRRKGKGGGGLKVSLGVKAVKGSRGKTLALAVIGPRKKVVRQIPRGRKTVKSVPAFYAHLVEKGTAPHDTARGAKRKKAAGPGKHPGTKAQPFLAPAYESNKAAVGAAVEKELAAGIEREIQKAAAKLKKV